jgi:hypothetical protein
MLLEYIRNRIPHPEQVHAVLAQEHTKSNEAPFGTLSCALISTYETQNDEILQRGFLFIKLSLE